MRRSHFSFVNLTLLESPQVAVESTEQLKNFGEFIRPDEEEVNFQSDIYSLNKASNEDLQQSWRVFTALKNADGVSQHNARRLENAAWRIQGIRKSGRTTSFDGTLPEPVAFDPPSTAMFTHEKLGDIIDKWDLSVGCVGDLLAYLRDKKFDRDSLLLPSGALRDGKGIVDTVLAGLTGNSAEDDVDGEQALYAVFSHSLERNGANNFCHFLLRSLVTTTNNRYILLAPKDGPMRTDFEDLGMEVVLINPNDENFLQTFEETIIQKGISAMLANTIMRCDVIIKAHDMKLPTVWVIHESWPQDKLDYYAKEVFLRKNLGAEMIKLAFRVCNCIVFPSNMQKGLYKGLYRERAAHTIYNGIPLRNLDEFKETRDRAEIRSSLGYGHDDFVVLHLGTICGRKGQIYTAQACTNFVKEDGIRNLKCLMVGARYIRDHEIAYIDRIKAAIEDGGLSWARFEDVEKEGPGALGKADFTLMDIQKNVLQFYMAADIVVVPSLNEVLPLVICEAMAFEKPVICSAIDAIPEAVSDNVEGLLVPPGDVKALKDAITKLYHDPALCQRLGAGGRRRVLNQFSYAHMCNLYRSLIQSGWKNATPPTSPTLLTVNEGLPPRVPLASSSIATGGHSGNNKGRMLAGTTVLVDMDNTIVDWDDEFIKRFKANAGFKSIEIDVEAIVRSRKHFEIERNFPESMRQGIFDIIAEKGFFVSLKPFPGAIEALKEMVASGVNVRLVTSPHPTCPGSCASEKYEFVVKHLGSDWVDRLIIARDKTPILGDVIVDDKPTITGAFKKPAWKHVHFDQPYNRPANTMIENTKAHGRLKAWSQWKNVISATLN